MIPAPPLENDDDRVASLERMNLLDTSREAEFDRIVRVTRRYFKADVVLITLVDKDRQWFKARCGLDAHETSREISFCGHAIAYDEVFVVENAKKDEEMIDLAARLGAGPEVKTKEQAVEHIEKIVLERSNGGDHKLF